MGARERAIRKLSSALGHLVNLTGTLSRTNGKLERVEFVCEAAAETIAGE